MCMAACSNYAPRYKHPDISSAIVEAKRLHAKLNCNITILKIVGTIQFVDIPVTKRETKIDIDQTELEIKDDLPF